jgi:hypothetical protein
MGVNVIGYRNTEASFDSSWWSWRPIVDLMCQVNLMERLKIKAQVFHALGYREGAGIKSETLCHRLADAIANRLADDTRPKFFYDAGVYVRADGTFVEKGELVRTEPIFPAHSVSRERVADWIDFLRSCGGFEVR